MPFKIEYDDGLVRAWHTTDSGARACTASDYTPTIYVSAHSPARLGELDSLLSARGDVAGTARERWRTAFRRDTETVLRIDVTDIDRIRPLAGWIRRRERPGTYRLYNVDFSRQFRFCLERDCDPVPSRALRQCTLTAPEAGAPDAPVTALEIDGERVAGGPKQLLTGLETRLDAVDPDVLVVSAGALVPALFETASQVGYDFSLGRRAGYEKLAGASNYESYGQVGHSPARYDVPGRVILDRSNTFFYRETNLAGCLDLVERSRKPLQELSWASIGNVLTAIQIREALARGVLVPWKSWRHELPKTMRQLHAGDRGGFTFSPVVGVHEEVHELDFASLYPNIICTRNVSPETVRCDCHADRADVPGLEYGICDEPGYLPDVLQPIVDARATLKDELAATDDPDRQSVLAGKSSALKWILVSCFGYQGFSNAKFGRIECHETINAIAREILLDAKAALEDAGWRVLHGIVDSLWVTACEGATQQPLDSVAAQITESTGIRLEHEAGYDWIAFVPRRDSDAGALTKYFGRRHDGTDKYRGIACRQRHTAPFVADCQRALVETFDATRDPDAVCQHLASWVDRLEAGAVEPGRLQRTRRASKRLAAYEQRTRTTAALRRAADAGIERAPGQDVTYVVVDDDRSDRDRVRLAHEGGDGYDAAFYRDRLVRAATAVLSPLGWRREDVETALGDRETATLDRFTG